MENTWGDSDLGPGGGRHWTGGGQLTMESRGGVLNRETELLILEVVP